MQAGMLRFRHCGSVIYSASRGRCPLCGGALSFGLQDAPLALPVPFTDGHGATCCLLVAAQQGAAAFRYYWVLLLFYCALHPLFCRVLLSSVLFSFVLFSCVLRSALFCSAVFFSVLLHSIVSCSVLFYVLLCSTQCLFSSTVS